MPLFYAHHKHRQGGENPGNFGDCMKGRIRFMTAITPAYAHAYQTTCLVRHLPAVPHHNFRLPQPKAKYPFLPNARSLTRERGNDYRGWAIYTDGGTRIVDGEYLAGWGVVSRRVATIFCFTFLYLLLLVHFLSCISVSTCGCGKNGHHLSQGRHSMFLRLPCARKGCVGEAPR